MNFFLFFFDYYYYLFACRNKACVFLYDSVVSIAASAFDRCGHRSFFFFYIALHILYIRCIPLFLFPLAFFIFHTKGSFSECIKYFITLSFAYRFIIL